MIYEVFSKSNCIITGAASGIGLELVRQISGSNPNLLLVDINFEQLEELKKEFSTIQGIVSCDLSHKSGNEQVMDWVAANWTHVDFCFANAGKAEYGPAENQNWKIWIGYSNSTSTVQFKLGLCFEKYFPESHFA